MSELNVYHHELRPDEYDEFYLKSEADKVIAELKQKLNEAQTELELWRDGSIISEAHQKELDEKRHSDCKRCLAMRNMCRYAQYSYSYLMENESCKIRPNNIDFRRYNEKYHFFIRWRKRWIELAEKFKPNNEVNNG